MTFEHLSTGKTSDPRTLTSTLGGTWYGRYGRARCPVCGGNKHNPPLSIKRGHSGILLHCFKGCDYRDIRNTLSVYGFGGDAPMTPAETLRGRQKQEAEAAKKAAQAEACWNKAQPIAGTLAEDYLRGRGITGDLPETLRFHPECWHGATARKLPAMVARIDGGERFGIHRTYLTEDGRKADVEPNKMMLGCAKGGAVRLRDGTGSLLIGEGIESTLSAMALIDAVAGPVWASLSTSGMMALKLPLGPRELVVAVDGEDAGRKAGRCLARRAAAAGWKVATADPGDGKDFNDLLLEGVVQ